MYEMNKMEAVGTLEDMIEKVAVLKQLDLGWVRRSLAFLEEGEGPPVLPAALLNCTGRVEGPPAELNAGPYLTITVDAAFDIEVEGMDIGLEKEISIGLREIKEQLKTATIEISFEEAIKTVARILSTQHLVGRSGAEQMTPEDLCEGVAAFILAEMD